MSAHSRIRLAPALGLGFSLFLLGCEPLPSSLDEVLGLIPDDPNQATALVGGLVADYRASIGARDPVPPPGLDYVLQNADAFASDAATLSEVLSADPVEDLAGLSGCWGGVWVAPPREVPGTVAIFDHYDAESGRYESWTLIRFGPLWPMQLHEVGTFRIVDSNHVEWTVEQSWASDDLTGAMERDPALEGGTFTSYVVLVDDRYYEGEDPDPTDDEAAFQVYRRLECP